MYSSKINNNEDETGEMGKNQHVLKREKGWAVKGEGDATDTSTHDTQQEAINAGREKAKQQQSELLFVGRTAKFERSTATGQINFHQGVSGCVKSFA